jgi:hypothetical protein
MAKRTSRSRTSKRAWKRSSVLERLTPVEARVVLERLILERPQLLGSAERIASEILGDPRRDLSRAGGG